jgi:hypothetical protein
MQQPEGAMPKPQPVDLSKIKTLREATQVFFSRRGPRLLAKNVAATWAVRACLGPPSITEVPVVASIAAWWPFQEWLAHKYLLHFVPREKKDGSRVDLMVARIHRAHHRDPNDFDLTLLPVQVVRAGIPASYVVALATSFGSPRRAASGAATWATMMLLYEWTHFLVHTGYRPKTKFFRRVRRNHRHHHYHNESYWLSFTWPDVDRWLHTEPEAKSVPHSDTARNLHGLAD